MCDSAVVAVSSVAGALVAAAAAGCVVCGGCAVAAAAAEAVVAGRLVVGTAGSAWFSDLPTRGGGVGVGSSLLHPAARAAAAIAMVIQTRFILTDLAVARRYFLCYTATDERLLGY
jgi:hypothetical protein